MIYRISKVNKKFSHHYFKKEEDENIERKESYGKAFFYEKITSPKIKTE
jgi:hypothetical protein